MGNLISTEKYCTICDSYDHINSDHKSCNYCLDSHETLDHQCEKCDILGHNDRQHCPYANCKEFHKSFDHTCTICGLRGHENSKDMHQKCYVCKGKIKYTHHTDGHIYYIGIKNMSEEEIDKFKYCKICCRTGYTKDNRCIFCENEVPEIIRCSRDNCGYTDKNSIKGYCPYCGKHITSE